MSDVADVFVAESSSSGAQPGKTAVGLRSPTIVSLLDISECLVRDFVARSQQEQLQLNIA
jgi:hypothetical protein